MTRKTEKTDYTVQRQAALSGCRGLFLRPGGAHLLETADFAADGFVELLTRLVETAVPQQLSALPETGREIMPADLANELARKFDAGKFASRLLEALFWALTRNHVLPSALPPEPDEETEFLLEQAAAILNFPAALAAAVPQGAGNWSPGARAILRSMPPVTTGREAAERIAAGDPFAGGRAFRYLDGRFLPATLEKIRPVDHFFGFPSVRRIFHEHFRDFARGKECVPLLISSLPGHGKTQLTIAHALAHENLTLILAAAEMLEQPLEALIEALRQRPDRRFVVFFDDINPESLDWYTFRTNVGGTFSPPGNVLLAIAGNYEFPAEILSRGRSVAFPTFDDVRCQEMVEDFLKMNGIRHPNPNLISLVAAEYTEEFGQKRYTELSPRTLMRHLALYEHDQRRRRDAIQLSCGPMVTKPDAQLFYEFNIRLMRKLYGNEYIENLLKEKLRAME